MDVKMTNDNLEGLPNDLIYSIQKIYVPAGLQVTTKALRKPESSEYGACRFGLNDYGIAFRVAKTTPTKLGQFVAIWKRPTPKGEIAPLDTTDNVDFVIVFVSSEIHRGQFIFDQKILLEKRIMSQGDKEGKRAFRIYPPWTTSLSKEALKTQKWQLPYFFSLDQNLAKNFEEIRKLFQQKRIGIQPRNSL